MRRILLGAAMAAMLAGAGLGPLPAQAQGNLFQPLVYVNDSAVTRYELDQRVRFMQLLRAPDSDPVTAEKALIDDRLRLRARPNLRFAGQVTGVEGYVESAAMGLLAGRMAAAELTGRHLAPPPPETAMGALVTHITGGAEAKTFQPMNVNFGILPPVETRDANGRRIRDKKQKKQLLAEKALAAIEAFKPQIFGC